jgi:hypothetical protein
VAVHINWIAVILATLSSMVIGSLWYGKALFGPMWSKLVKRSDKDMRKGMALSMVIAILSSFFMAFVLAHLAYIAHYFYDGNFLVDTMLIALLIWTAFQAFRIVMHDAFEGRRRKLTLINVANDFVTLMVMALIIGLMKP